MAQQTIAVADLETLVTRTMEASNVAGAIAISVARALVQAEVDGQKGHGLSRVSSYAAQAKSGKVDGRAIPQAVQSRPSSVLVDAKNGFAFPAINLAIDWLPELASVSGIAAAGITRSHHAGVIGYHVERLAEAGLVALAFGNTPKAMAPWGGRQPIYGTNPIAFAVPHRGHPPIVVDMALSQVARGKILTAAQRGEAIPEGWAVDEKGASTTDAKAALKGALQPIGGAKGAALALMVEVLAVALTGAKFGFEASSFFDAEGPPPGVGQFLIAIDPRAFCGADLFADRMAALASMIEGDGDARLPGSRRIALREKAAHEGIEVDAKLLAEARAIAGA